MEGRVWLTVPFVAQQVDRSIAAIQQLIRAGQIPAVKVGREWRIHPEYLDRLLAAADARAAG